MIKTSNNEYYSLFCKWQELVQNPSGKKSMDDFAKLMNHILKIVFSNSHKNTGWDSDELAKRPLKEEVKALKQHEGKDILVGSRSLIFNF